MKPRRQLDTKMRMKICSTSSSLLLLLLLLTTASLCISSTDAFAFHHSSSTSRSVVSQRRRGAKTAANYRCSSTRRHAQPNFHDDDDDFKTADNGRVLDSTKCTPPLQQRPSQQPSFSTLTATLSLALLLLLSSPLPAHAGFGPSSGATTTPPPGLKSPETLLKNNNLDSSRSNKKLSTAISSTLDERRLQEFNAQLDQIIDALREKNENNNGGIDLEGDGTVDIDSQQQLQSSMDNDNDTLEKARLLQTQIQSRQQLLDRLERQPYWFNYLAAFLGSISSTLVMHPVDTIKTRLMISANPDSSEEDFLWQGPVNDTMARNFMLQQPDTDGHHSRHATNGTVAMMNTADAQHHHHATTATASSNAINSQNFGSLYQGLTGNLWKEGPPSAVYLGVYETVKYALAPKVASAYLLLVYLIAGAAGELVGSVIRAPAEATKSLVQSRVTSNAMEAVQQVLFTESGRSTVVRAWQASVFRDVPFGAVQLATFECIKAFILNNPNIDFDSSTLQAEAIIGAFAGGFGALLTNPADVITTRIITAESSAGNGETTSNEAEEQPLDVFGWAKKIYEEEGPQAFMVGWQARVGYWAPAISIFLTCYCSVRQAGIKYDWFP